MTNILEALAIPDIVFLDSLAEELDGVLSKIGWDGKAKDRKYIAKMQKEFREKYEKKIESFGKDSDQFVSSTLGKFVRNISDAYYALQNLNNEGDPETEAQDAVMENLFYFTEKALI